MQIVVQDKHLQLDKEVVLAIIFASIAVTLVILSAFCACFIWRRNDVKSDEGNIQISDTNGEFTPGPVLNHCKLLSIRESILEVEYALIEAVTDNFSESNILGKGRHGVTYKAHFNFDIVAAVKKIDNKVSGLERAFEKEIVLLSNIQHPNIISLLGYSVYEEARVIVYELIQNGSLETQLNGSSRGLNLTWQHRMKIALDMARGLEYLHEHCNPPLVHRALKSSNVSSFLSFYSPVCREMQVPCGWFTSKVSEIRREIRRAQMENYGMLGEYILKLGIEDVLVANLNFFMWLHAFWSS